jgi:hypothetical protein
MSFRMTTGNELFLLLLRKEDFNKCELIFLKKPTGCNDLWNMWYRGKSVVLPSYLPCSVSRAARSSDFFVLYFNVPF